MSAILSTTIRPSLATKLGAYLDRVSRYFVYRAAVIHLRGLDDEALLDVGLGRSQIEAAVRGEDRTVVTRGNAGAI